MFHLGRKSVLCVSLVLILGFVAGCGQLQGRVYDTRSSLPVSGAQVRLVGTGFVATTNGSGYYSIDGIPPGSYTVTCSAAGYTLFSYGPIEIPAHVITYLDFVLVPEL